MAHLTWGLNKPGHNDSDWIWKLSAYSVLRPLPPPASPQPQHLILEETPSITYSIPFYSIIPSVFGLSLPVLKTAVVQSMHNGHGQNKLAKIMIK